MIVKLSFIYIKLVLICDCSLPLKVSEYEQEIPQSQAVDQPIAP